MEWRRIIFFNDMWTRYNKGNSKIKNKC
jgi:hypothetical protein